MGNRDRYVLVKALSSVCLNTPGEGLFLDDWGSFFSHMDLFKVKYMHFSLDVSKQLSIFSLKFKGAFK